MRFCCLSEMEESRMCGDCRTLSTTVKEIGASGKEKVKANPELLASQ